MSPTRVSLRVRGSSRKVVQDEPKGRTRNSSDDGDNASEASSEPSGSPPSSPASDGVASSSSSASSVRSDSSSDGSAYASTASSSERRSSSKRKRASKKKRSGNEKHNRSAIRDTLTLEVPKLTGADDYELWRTMIELKLKVQKLWSLVTEEVVQDSSWSSTKKRRWNERWLKAQAVIASSLGPRLAGRYRRLLVSCDPVQLFQEIEKEYNAGSAAKNDILIKAAMFARKLAKRERVDTYIDAVMQLQEDLVALGHPLEDAELARLLLTNALEVFPDLSTELVGARMKAKEFEVGQVRGRLLAREQEENMRLPPRGNVSQTGGNATGSPGGQSTTNAVFQFSHGRNDGHGNHQYQGRGNQSRRRSLKEAMQRRPCAKCGKLGHWHRDCWQKDEQYPGNQQKNNGNRGSSSQGGSRGGGRGGGRHGKSGPKSFMASIGGVMSVGGPDVVEWCLDSAATANICNDLSLFTEISTISDGLEMLCANGNTVVINQAGTVKFSIVNELTGRQEKRLLPDVYYVPDAPANLLSQDYMQTKLNYFVSMSADQLFCFLSKEGMRLKFVKVGGLYRLWSSKQHKKKPVIYSAIVSSSKSVPLAVWHKRFVHASDSTIRDMDKKKAVHGLNIATRKENISSSCLPCVHGKKIRMTYPERLVHATHPLQRLQVDVCSVNELTIDGSTAFLLVVDEFSRYKWIYLLRHKSESKSHIIALVNRLHVKYRAKNWRVEEIHSDQGGEFDNTCLQEFSAKEGIFLSTTNGYTPQENGIVERANGIVLPKVRALRHMTNLPELLWGEAAQHVVYTLNVTATRVLGGATPHEKFSGQLPDVSCLRTWGCLTYYHIASAARSRKKKLSSRVGTSILIGYSPATYGYKVLDLSSGAVSTHRGGNLTFAEDYTVARNYIDMLLSNVYNHGDHDLPARVSLVPMQMQLEDAVRLDSEKESILVQTNHIVEAPGTATPANPAPIVGQPDIGVLPREVPRSTPVVSAAEGDTVARHKISRFGRKRKRSSRLDNFELHLAVLKVLKTFQSELRPISESKLHSRDVPIPANYKQAIRSKFASQWQAAMDDELESLRRHGVWIVVERSKSKGAQVITNRWVYTVKKDEQGFVKRFKARLVIHGFKQVFGINYNETFAPVIRFDTIRVAIYFAVQRRWAVLQYDVKTAFLHGKLAELVFMELPQGCGSPGNQRICQLIKSLYGLKQAPHVWNKTLHRHLIALGFNRLESDHGLYSLIEKGEVIMLLTVYVDDLLLMGEQVRCEAIARKLASNFELVMLGPVKYLLGIEVSINRASGSIFFSQLNYVDEVLRRFHMHDCRGVATPETTAVDANGQDSTTDISHMPYREAVGAFQYLVSGSRPDIAHVVRRLGQYMSCFTEVHYAQVKRVLRYLQATKDFGLSMVVSSSTNVDLQRIEAYSDADYSNDKIDRQSVSGYVTMLNGSVISYGSRKQGLNAQSTMEAEYIAMNEGARDIMWLRGLCDELKWKYDLPKLWCDNTAAITLSKKPGKHNGSKHIENRFHYVRNLEDREMLAVEYCGTNDMTADILTKPLARVKFEYFRNLLGVVRRAEQERGKTTSNQDVDVFTVWMMINFQSDSS